MANEVGRVSVRVFPDTRGFAFQAKRELKKLKDLTYKIKVELDDKKFKSQVDALIAETNAELMKPEKRIKFRASLEASERQLRSEVRDIRNRMQAQASQEKVEFETELSKSSSRKSGGSDILGLDPKKAVKALERELRGHHYELPVYANMSRAQADIRRMSRSEEFEIDVDLNVNRKAVHKDVESIRDLIKTTAKALSETKALKFAVDVDKGSVKKWGDEVRKVEASLERQRKAYRNTQRELKIVTDRAADYGKAVSDATKRIAKIKAEEVADLKREQDLTNELAQIRKNIARTVGDTTDLVLREKRIVGQISDLRANAFDRSAKRADAEAAAVAEIRDASREITRLKKERARLAGDEIKNYGKIQSLLVDEKRLQKQLDRARNKLEMDAIELDVNLDQTSVEAVSARLIQLSRDRVATIWVNMQKANLARLERQWGRISEHTSNLAVNTAKWMGQLTGVRVLWKTFKDMVEILPKLDMMVPQLAQNLALITAGTAGAIGGVGVLFTLLSDIGEVGKLILGLPAAIAGIAGSALIMGRAFKDFEAVFPEVISYYEKLGDLVSSRVWKRAAGPIRELHKATKPLLDAHVPGWATAWGDSLASLSKGLSSDNALGNLEIFLKNSIKGTKNARKGWESLGNAIMSMVGGGSGVFPDLGTWFSDTMADFEIWAQKNQSQIGRWLREGGTALRELGSIGVSTVKIIAGLADAFDAAGWPGLTELERGMKSLGESALTLSKNSGFMYTLEKVHDFFESLGTLGPQATLAFQNAWTMIGRTIDELTGPITGALGGILDGFNSSKFQSGFRTFVDGLGSFIEDITPGIKAMTEEIGSLLGVVGEAGKSWGPGFNDMLMLFSTAGDKLHPGLIDFIKNTGPQLQDLVKDITPHVEDFAEAISDLLGNKNFQDLVGDLIGDLGTLIGVALDLGKAIVSMAEDFADWYGSLSQGEKDVVRWAGIITAALGGLSLVIGRFAITLAFSPLGPVVAKALAKAMPVGGLMVAVKGALKGFVKGFGVAAIVAAIGEVLTPLVLAETATDIVNMVGLGDTAFGEFVKSFEDKVRENFGDKSLLDISIDSLKGAWGNAKEGDWLGAIKDTIFALVPQFNFAILMADSVLEAMGMTPEEIAEGRRIAGEKIRGLFGGGGDKELNPGRVLGVEITKEADKQFDEAVTVVNGYTPPEFDYGAWTAEQIDAFFGGDPNPRLETKGVPVPLNPNWAPTVSDGIIDPTQEQFTGVLRDLDYYEPPKFHSDQWTEEQIAEFLGYEPGKPAPGTYGSGVTVVPSPLNPNWRPTVSGGIIDPTEEQFQGVLRDLDEFEPPAWDQGEWTDEKVGEFLGSGGGGGTDPVEQYSFPSVMGGNLLAHDWGKPLYDQQVKPYLDRGFGTLKEEIANWSPAGDAGMGSAIDRALGTDPASTGRTAGAFNTMGRKVGEFAAGVVGSFGSMGQGGRREIAGLTDNTEIEFGSMSNSSQGDARSMNTGVVGQFSAMATRAVAQAARLQVGAQRAMAQANVQMVAQGRQANAGFVAQMTAMAARAISVVNILRGGLQSALRVNVSGSGRYTGDTFVSGLAAGLSRAVGVARGMAGSIRSALSFSAYSSGSSVGGTFASGLRARVRTVASAADALARAARARMPNSPADEGPFSGSGWGGWGESIAEEMARGLRKAAPEVAREAERLMGGVHSVMDARANPIAVDFARTRRRSGLAGDSPIERTGTTVNVNVESRSEDPLQDGNRFGGDIAFALRGAGLA